MGSKGVLDDDCPSISHPLPVSSKLSGAIPILMILLTMICGPLSPLFLFLLFWLEYYTFGVILSFLLFFPFLLTIDESPFLCRFMLDGASWFDHPVTLHLEDAVIETIKKHDGSMWCMHPHGTSVGFGFVLNGAIRFKADLPSQYLPQEVEQYLSQDRLRQISGVQAPVLFKIPILSVLLQKFGCCTPATKEAMFHLFRNRADFGILPGGMEEVALYEKGVDRIFIKNRAGFIKYALQHGYTLVLGFTFGESELYSNLKSMSKINMWLVKKFGFVVPIFWGPYWYCPLLPRRDVQLDTVMGGVIKLPLIENPTNDEIAFYHQQYINEITKLYSNYKERFGSASKELQIF
jgi:hypothetical protein